MHWLPLLFVKHQSFLFRRYFHALMFSILFEPATLSYFSLSSHIISRHCSNFVIVVICVAVPLLLCGLLGRCYAHLLFGQQLQLPTQPVRENGELSQQYSKRSRSRSDPSKGTRYKHANIPRSVRNFKLDHLSFKQLNFKTTL